MSNIDLGNTPVGTPPTPEQSEQIRNSLGLDSEGIMNSISSAIGNGWREPLSALIRPIAQPLQTESEVLATGGFIYGLFSQSSEGLVFDVKDSELVESLTVQASTTKNLNVEKCFSLVGLYVSQTPITNIVLPNSPVLNEIYIDNCALISSVGPFNYFNGNNLAQLHVTNCPNFTGFEGTVNLTTLATLNISGTNMPGLPALSGCQLPVLIANQMPADFDFSALETLDYAFLSSVYLIGNNLDSTQIDTILGTIYSNAFTNNIFDGYINVTGNAVPNESVIMDLQGINWTVVTD